MVEERTVEFVVDRVADLEPGSLRAMAEEATAEGHAFVQRLVDDFEAGSHRFELPGEALFVAAAAARPVGIGGLNIDPYLDDARVGRLRHLYVDPEWRRNGVGRAIVGAVIDLARLHFDVLRLRTDNPAAAAFYVSLGFVPIGGNAHCTHLLTLAG
jgi:GNAT superfamily N-acetyltransferase